MIYLYKRKYRKIEEMLKNIQDTFVVLQEQVNPAKAYSFHISAVPSLIVLNSRGKVCIKRQGLALVEDYLYSLEE
jgi:hypothetical protein